MLEDGRGAGIDALRVALGTVPGTVPRVIWEGTRKRNLRVIPRPIWTLSPTANRLAYSKGTDRSIGGLTPTVSCRAKRKASSLAVCRATCRWTWTGTCEASPTASFGYSSPETVACPDVTRSGGLPSKARAASGPRPRGRRNQQQPQERTKAEVQRTKCGQGRGRPGRCRR